MESGPQEHGAPRRTWLRLLIGCGIVGAVLLLAMVVFVVAGFVRESRAIEAVRARGEPLTPAEITFPPTAVESELLERMQRLRRAFEAGGPLFGYWLAMDRADILDELRAAPGWSGAIEPVERLFDCLGDDDRGAKDVATAIEARLSDPRRALALAPCERDILLARGAVEEPLLELALDVCRSAPETGERATRAWTPARGPSPDLDRSPAFIFVAVRSVTAVAIARAIEGRSTEAIEILELAFRGSGLLREWPSTFECVAANGAWLRALRALQATLPFLPPDADLTHIDAALASWDPMRALERAILGERAFGNEIFAALRDGRLSGSEFGSDVPNSMVDALVWSLLGHDHAAYLDIMGRGALWTRKPYGSIAAEVETLREQHSGSLSLKVAVVTQMLVPRLDAQLKDAAITQAVVGLARAALRARRDGAQAGIDAAGASPDPFRSGPLQARLDPDGVLVLWSVGPDLEDQVGRDEFEEGEDGYEIGVAPPDIVWRVRPR